MAMSQCTAITRGGERCKGVAIDASGLCYSHSPNHADARKRAARKGGQRGGRGRLVTELASIKTRLESLAEDMLAGRIDRSDAAVAGQLLNYAIRAVSVGLKAREQEEFEARLAEIEEALERQRGGTSIYGSAG
jgi:hypothetical protein